MPPQEMIIPLPLPFNPVKNRSTFSKLRYNGKILVFPDAVSKTATNGVILNTLLFQFFRNIFRLMPIHVYDVYKKEAEINYHLMKVK
jgi:hypothetical protein